MKSWADSNLAEPSKEEQLRVFQRIPRFRLTPRTSNTSKPPRSRMPLVTLLPVRVKWKLKVSLLLASKDKETTMKANSEASEVTEVEETVVKDVPPVERLTELLITETESKD